VVLHSGHGDDNGFHTLVVKYGIVVGGGGYTILLSNAIQRRFIDVAHGFKCA
jgi:hypothetical protein